MYTLFAIKASTALLVLLHVGVALACVAVARQSRTHAPGAAREARLWWLYAVVLLLMGLNALWRLEEVWLGSWRNLARHEAWYADRGTVQLWALLVLLVLATLALAWQGLARGRRRPTAARKAALAHRLVRAGLALLLLHLALRTVSWHTTDQLIYTRVAMISLGRWLDLVGLGLVALGGWRR